MTTYRSLRILHQPMHKVLRRHQPIRLVTFQIWCLGGDAGEVQVEGGEPVHQIPEVVWAGDDPDAREIGAIDRAEEAKVLHNNEEADRAVFLPGMTGNRYCILDAHAMMSNSNNGSANSICEIFLSAFIPTEVGLVDETLQMPKIMQSRTYF